MYVKIIFFDIKFIYFGILLKCYIFFLLNKYIFVDSFFYNKVINMFLNNLFYRILVYILKNGINWYLEEVLSVYLVED